MEGPTGATAGSGCWICGSTRLERAREGAVRRLDAERLRITDASYGATLPLWRCRECGFLFAADADGEALAEIYGDLDDAGYAATAHARRRQMRWILDRMLQERPGARSLLDVGAGMGLLVKEATSRGLGAAGVEPSRTLSDLGRRQGAAVLTGTLPHPSLQGRRFDLVSLVDVLEHVTEPVRLLQECGSHLAAGGILAVVTPDAGSVAARMMGARWWHYRPAHVGYFSAATLARAARAAGLREVRRTRPRWYLPLGYLVRRGAVCLLPGERAGAARPRRGMLGALGRIVVPVDLRDSLLVLFERGPDVR